MAWWDRLAFYKRVTLFAGMITAVISAGFTVANALNAGEPWWITTHGYARALVAQATSKIEATQTQLKKDQLRVQLQVLQGRVESVKAKISDRELLLQKKEGPDEYRRLVQQQVDDFKESLARLSEQLVNLRAELNRLVLNNGR